MKFQKISKPDIETLKLFIPYRKIFPYSSNSASKQLKKIIKNTITFYKVFDNFIFIGCLFVDNIDEQNKIIEFGGFAARKVNTFQAIKELIAFLKYHYPEYRIKAITSQRTAKFCLTRVGFLHTNGGYIYEK